MCSCGPLGASITRRAVWGFAFARRWVRRRRSLVPNHCSAKKKGRRRGQPEVDMNEADSFTISPLPQRHSEIVVSSAENLEWPFPCRLDRRRAGLPASPMPPCIAGREDVWLMVEGELASRVSSGVSAIPRP